MRPKTSSGTSQAPVSRPWPRLVTRPISNNPQRWLPWWGIGGAAFVAVIAAFDVDQVPGFAAIEFGLAIAGLFISIACFAGLFRRAG